MTEPGEDGGRWLDSAVRFARPHLGTLGGHPAVGALIVDEETGQVLARAVAGADGSPTAAVAVVAEAGMNAHDRTIFTTLEPSVEDARMLVAAGLARAVIGVAAPGPERGTAVALMRELDMDVVVADHPGSAALHAAWLHRIVRNRPLTTLRLAISRDGMIGRGDGVPMELAGEEARRWLGLQRALSDAVMIGARTAELDDPPLLPDLKGLDDRSYVRIVAVGASAPPASLRLLRGGHPVWIVCEPGRDFGLPPPTEFITLDGRKGRPDLRRAMAILAGRGISSLFVEGGARLTEAMLAAELADRFQLIETPVDVGRAGLPATPLGGIHGRLRAAGFVEIDARDLGPDRLRIYERRI